MMQFAIQSLKWRMVNCMREENVTILIEDLSIWVVQAVYCLVINLKLSHIFELTCKLWQLVHPTL